MNYILSSKNVKIKNKYRICVLIHLHYDDSVNKYRNYIKNIPEHIDILISYSNLEVFYQMQNIASEVKNKFIYIEKKNRGRDISALLVAAKKELLKYDIICFVHDKKSKNEIMKKDTEEWAYSLWENTLSSKEYIENVVSIFENDNRVGVLVPPLYFGEYFLAEYINQWGNNYNILVELLKETGVTKIPSKDSIIKAFGTVFWARTNALRKLFNRKWKYEDFDEEPLSIDGTISHAIERSICFYAEDVGYECHTIMTKQYADVRMQQMQNALFYSFDIISRNLGCKNLFEIKNYEKQKKDMREFCSRFNKVYIYGAGIYGKDCLKILQIINIRPSAFVVSSKKNYVSKIADIQVVELQKCELDGDTGIIVAVSKKNRSEILDMLTDKIKQNNIYIYTHNS